MSADLLLVVIAAFGAGLVDAMVGGGGLIQLPALLTAYPSTPPAVLLGTNKFASIFGTGSAVVRFARGVRIPWRMLLPLVPVVFLGALAGARVATLVPPAVFRPLVPVMLAVVLVYILWRKDLGASHAPLAITRGRALAAAALLGGVGFYDGFFGPGTGTLLIVGYLWLLGEAADAASANAKVVNFASNLAAVAWFGAHGAIVWSVSLPMAAGQFVGALVGAHVVLRRGGGVVRVAAVAVALALVAKLTWGLVG